VNRAITFHRCYADGEPYRPARSRDGGRTVPLGFSFLDPGKGGWAEWWGGLQAELRRRGYRRNTLVFYRQVIRSLAGFSGRRPGEITREAIDAFLGHITRHRGSWNWPGMVICTLRTLFDKLGGKDLTAGMKTPRRSRRLPEYVTLEEVRGMLKQAETLRDQLLVGLLYGCGLRPLEACSLKWEDVDPSGKAVRIHDRRAGRFRECPLPEKLLPIVEQGKRHAQPDAYVFAGMRKGTHLGTGMVDIIVKTLAGAAGIDRRVTAMMLRHGYAMHCLQYGYNVREVQVLLGHRDVKTTMRYVYAAPPADAVSPLDGPVRPPAETPEHVFDREELLMENLAGLLNPESPLKSFYRLLKTRLTAGFGALRSPVCRLAAASRARRPAEKANSACPAHPRAGPS